jgi:hypothetical protein
MSTERARFFPAQMCVSQCVNPAHNHNILTAKVVVFRHRISVLCGVLVIRLYFNTHGNTPHEEFQSIMRKTVQEWLNANDNGRGIRKKKLTHRRLLKRRAMSNSRTKSLKQHPR